MAKNLAALKASIAAAQSTNDVDLGPPYGTIRVRQLTAKQTLELLDIWKKAGICKVTEKPDGSTDVEVTLDPTVDNLEEAYDAFFETVIRGAIDDEGKLLFDSDEGRTVAADLPLDALAALCGPIMELSGAKKKEGTETGN